MLKDKDKIKSYLAHIYPELTRFIRFQNLVHIHQIKMAEKYRLILRIAIPSFVFLLVLIIGTWLGGLINGLRDPVQIQPNSPLGIAPIPKESYSSPYREIKQKMIEFNPSLPEPLYPILDYKISLEAVSASKQ